MKSFKSYIRESRMTTLGEITAAIAGYKKAGEILNPVYQDLSSQSRRIFGSDTNAVRNVMLKHMHADNRTQELTDLYYDWPNDSFVSLGKAERTLAKLKDTKFKDVISAANDVIKRWKPIVADLKELKGKVVKVTQKRAEAKTAATASMKIKFADSSSLIKIFESHLEEYKNMAKTRAKAFIDDKLNVLKKAGWDIDKVAPRPGSRISSSEYKTATTKRSLYSAITKSKSTYRQRGEPDIVEINHTMVQRYIDQAVQGAEEAYRKFMAKMIEKIGKPVIDAKMTGNIWSNAILTVTTNDGEEQVWHTQMIINFSKYQTMFNQFPSRRKK